MVKVMFCGIFWIMIGKVVLGVIMSCVGFLVIILVYSFSECLMLVCWNFMFCGMLFCKRCMEMGLFIGCVYVMLCSGQLVISMSVFVMFVS